MQAIRVSSQQQEQRAIRSEAGACAPKNGHQVTILPGDADLNIVETALKIANDGLHATVVTDDRHVGHVPQQVETWPGIHISSLWGKEKHKEKSSNHQYQRDGIIAT